METILDLLFKKKPLVSLPKKVSLIQVPNQTQFEDMTLTREFLDYVNDRLKVYADNLIGGAWEDESQARELVGYLRACEELKAKYNSLYKQLYNR